MKLSVIKHNHYYYINKMDDDGNISHCVWGKDKTVHTYPANYDKNVGYLSRTLCEFAYSKIKEELIKNLPEPDFVIIKEEEISKSTTLTLESAKAIVSASRGAGTTVSPELLDQALILLKESGVEND